MINGNKFELNKKKAYIYSAYYCRENEFCRKLKNIVVCMARARSFTAIDRRTNSEVVENKNPRLKKP